MDLSICNRLLQHNRSLLIIVYETVIAKGVTDFANNCEQLKYGLHLDAVTSRRGPQSGRWHRSYKIHSSIKYGLHLDAVTPRRGPQSGMCHRSYKIHLSTKYGLHCDAVISRWLVSLRTRSVPSKVLIIFELRKYFCRFILPFAFFRP